MPIRQTGNSVCRWKTICVGEYSFAFLQTGDARVNKQMLGLYHVSIPTFLFNSFFFLLEMDFKYRNGLYTVYESFKRIKLSYSFAIESLSLVFIEIELTRTRMSCIFYSRDNLLIFTFQTSFLFTFLN